MGSAPNPDLGGTVLAVSPADFGRLVAEETEKWGEVIKFSGAKSYCVARPAD